VWHGTARGGCVGADGWRTARALVTPRRDIARLELDRDAEDGITVPMNLDLHPVAELTQTQATFSGHTLVKSARRVCDAVCGSRVGPTLPAWIFYADSIVAVSPAPMPRT
jgi:hypothetical protein